METQTQKRQISLTGLKVFLMVKPAGMFNALPRLCPFMPNIWARKVCTPSTLTVLTVTKKGNDYAQKYTECRHERIHEVRRQRTPVCHSLDSRQCKTKRYRCPRDRQYGRYF